MKRALLFGILSVGLLPVPTFAGDRRYGYSPNSYTVPRQLHDDHHRDEHHEPVYRVLYRVNHHHDWHEYGTYHTHDAADHVAHDLRDRGYETRVERD